MGDCDCIPLPYLAALNELNCYVYVREIELYCRSPYCLRQKYHTRLYIASDNTKKIYLFLEY